MKDYLLELNPPQQEAVKTTEGPVMVIAGAGSGKTRVLTYRIAWLLSQGISPFNILALTFTNKAAREMKERIAHLVGIEKARNLWMGTFHSIFARILRVEAEKLGFHRNFTIYDTDDSKRLIKAIVKEQNLDDKLYSAGSVLARISNAKNNLIGPVDYNDDFEIQNADYQARKPKLGLLYNLYQQRLQKALAMDFDDLLFNTNLLLRDFPETLYRYQNKFTHILVDEYQDTNYSQYLIVKKLAANNENICVVGDDAQSIYSFRGANIANILNFKQDYPDCKVFKLEQNYRSSQTIVDAANNIIVNNKDQIFKKVWTENAVGDKILVYKAKSEVDEAAWISKRIQKLSNEMDVPYSNFAILYRTNAQSRALEEALRRMGIAYRIFGGISFYQRKEVKDVLAYFRLVINPQDEDSFRRIINFPTRGIGDTTISKLEAVATEKNISLWDAALRAPQLGLGLNHGTLRRIEEFTTMIRGFSALLFKYNAFDLGERIVLQSGIRKVLFEDGTPEGLQRRESVEELLVGLQNFVLSVGVDTTELEFLTLDQFMEDISLLTDADIKKEELEKNPYVTLMTIHSAKGLEFPFVFVAGMEENLFPSSMALGSRAELEEERRLFYVAITRAMKQAALTWSESRFRYGQLNFCESSRFISEIEDQYLQYVDEIGKMPNKFSSIGGKFAKPFNHPNIESVNNPLPKPHDSQVDDGDYSILNLSQLALKMRVKHQRFGEGTITNLSGKGADAKAEILFDGDGKKQIMLKFARLRLL